MRISDWSSDVCSSDLVQCLFPKPINFQAEKNSSCPTFETGLRGVVAPTARKERASGWMAHRNYVRMLPSSWFNNRRSDVCRLKEAAIVALRSEERRVGKEVVSTCRVRWSPGHEKKN